MVGALLVPTLVSLGVKLGIRLAATLAKKAIESGDNGVHGVAREPESFAAVLDHRVTEQTSGIPGAPLSATRPEATSLEPDPSLTALAADRQARALATGVKVGLALPLPGTASDSQARRTIAAYRRLELG